MQFINLSKYLRRTNLIKQTIKPKLNASIKEKFDKSKEMDGINIKIENS